MIWVKTIISGLFEGITSSALKLFPSAVRRCLPIDIGPLPASLNSSSSLHYSVSELPVS